MEYIRKLDKQLPLESEQASLEAIVNKYETVLGRYEVIPVNDSEKSNVGYVLRKEGFSPKNKKVTVAFDLDDTIGQYTETRKQVEKMLIDVCTGFGISEDQALKLIRATRNYSRRAYDSSNPEKGSVYDPGIHAYALQSALNSRTMFDVPYLIDAFNSSSPMNPYATEDPGIIAPDKEILITDEITSAFNLYDESMPYDDLVGVMSGLRNSFSVTSSMGIITQGDPRFQLTKTLSVLSKAKAMNPDLDCDFIALTQITKGQFLVDQKDLFVDLSSAEKQLVVVVDDNRHQCKGLQHINNLLADQQSMTRILPIIARRPWMEHRDEETHSLGPIREMKLGSHASHDQILEDLQQHIKWGQESLFERVST